MLLVILKEKKLLDCFMKTKCKNTNRSQFRVEKVIQKKDDQLYVK